jgi:DNA-binding MarR family transcriptional regulator
METSMHDLSAMPLPRLVALAGRLASAQWRRFLDGHGLATTELTLLSAVAADGPLSHRDAARRCFVTAGGLTPVVDGLERAGRVERERDPGDRRVVLLRITPAGLAVVRKVWTSSEQGLAAFLPPDPETDEVVRRYLVGLIARLETGGTPDAD